MEDFRLEGPACARRSNERPRATLVRDRRLGVRGSNTEGARSKATTPAPLRAINLIGASGLTRAHQKEAPDRRNLSFLHSLHRTQKCRRKLSLWKVAQICGVTLRASFSPSLCQGQHVD